MKNKIFFALTLLVLISLFSLSHIARAQDSTDSSNDSQDVIPAGGTGGNSVQAPVTATPASGVPATTGTGASSAAAPGAPAVNLTSTPATPPTAGGPTNSTLNYSGLVKCDGVVDPSEPNRKTVCGFPQLFLTINTLITFLFEISIPITIVLFAYGGVLYMSGKESNIGQAKKIFVSVGIGFIIMLTMWVTVYQLVTYFVNTNSGATALIQTPQ